MYKYSNIKFRLFLNLIINCMFPMLIVLFIYIFFRNKPFYHSSNLENTYISNFIIISINSLPDALWIYSLTSLLIQIWYPEKMHNFFAFSPIILGLLFEVFQYTKIIPGTFCTFDILFMIIFYYLSLFTANRILKRRNYERQAI